MGVTAEIEKWELSLGVYKPRWRRAPQPKKYGVMSMFDMFGMTTDGRTLRGLLQ